MVNKKIISKIENEEIVKKKHNQIAEAAKELFTRKGYHSTSMREIADASGINLSYLYKYISSKDDILYLFHLYVYEQFSEIYDILKNSETEISIQQIIHFIKKFLEKIHFIKKETLTIYTETRHLQHDSMRSVLSLEASSIRLLENIILKGVQQGFFKVQNPFFASNVIHFIINIEPQRWWNLKTKYTFSRFVELMIEVILDILGVEQEHRIPPHRKKKAATPL
jgi:AcrR family transcriptional regulator